MRFILYGLSTESPASSNQTIRGFLSSMSPTSSSRCCLPPCIYVTRGNLFACFIIAMSHASPPRSTPRLQTTRVWGETALLCAAGARMRNIYRYVMSEKSHAQCWVNKLHSSQETTSVYPRNEFNRDGKFLQWISWSACSVNTARGIVNTRAVYIFAHLHVYYCQSVVVVRMSGDEEMGKRWSRCKYRLANIQRIAYLPR